MDQCWYMRDNCFEHFGFLKWAPLIELQGLAWTIYKNRPKRIPIQMWIWSRSEWLGSKRSSDHYAIAYLDHNLIEPKSFGSVLIGAQSREKAQMGLTMNSAWSWSTQNHVEGICIYKYIACYDSLNLVLFLIPRRKHHKESKWNSQSLKYLNTKTFMHYEFN